MLLQKSDSFKFSALFLTFYSVFNAIIYYYSLKIYYPIRVLIDSKIAK